MKSAPAQAASRRVKFCGCEDVAKGAPELQRCYQALDQPPRPSNLTIELFEVANGIVHPRQHEARYVVELLEGDCVVSKLFAVLLRSMWTGCTVFARQEGGTALHRWPRCTAGHLAVPWHAEAGLDEAGSACRRAHRFERILGAIALWQHAEQVDKRHDLPFLGGPAARVRAQARVRGVVADPANCQGLPTAALDHKAPAPRLPPQGDVVGNVARGIQHVPDLRGWQKHVLTIEQWWQMHCNRTSGRASHTAVAPPRAGSTFLCTPMSMSLSLQVATENQNWSFCRWRIQPLMGSAGNVQC